MNSEDSTQPIFQEFPSLEDEGLEDLAKKAKDHVMSKRWMVTAWTEHMGEDWTPRSLNKPENGILYCCYGCEFAPSTRREHWHVYLRFKAKTRMSRVIKLFGSNQVWCGTTLGNEEQCQAYCFSIGPHEKKQPLRLSFGEFGDFKASEGKQGRRTDLDEIANRILDGADDNEIARAYPVDYIRYSRGLQALREATKPLPPLQRNLEIYFFHGPTGTGKSYRVLTNPDWMGKVYTAAPGLHPWDGYTGQSILLLDEWASKDWDINLMKRLLDVHRLQLPARYKNPWAAWTTILICSNDSPAQAYNDQPQHHIEAFRRRIKNSCRLITKREDEGGPSLQQILQDTPTPQF